MIIYDHFMMIYGSKCEKQQFTNIYMAPCQKWCCRKHNKMGPDTEGAQKLLFGALRAHSGPWGTHLGALGMHNASGSIWDNFWVRAHRKVSSVPNLGPRLSFKGQIHHNPL